MKFGVFSIYDNKAQAYLPPFFLLNDSMAGRAVRDAMFDPRHMFARHANDFTLYRIGFFDDSVGVLEPLKEHVNLGLVASFKE